jgi:ornithine cyclodeaminase/alanine dehydrogenase-like protein (mu-crystallin family)
LHIRILTSADVYASLSVEKALDAMRTAFSLLSAGRVSMPLRSRLETPDGVSLVMSAYLHHTNDLGLKIVSIYDGNPQKGLPRVTATALVLDPQTGMPRAFMDAESLTALRTGAAGGLAADILARKDAETVTLFGMGTQGRSQLQSVLRVRSISCVFLFDTGSGSAKQLAAEMKSWPHAPRVHLTTSTAEAIQAADIVIAATNSCTPLFDGRDLKPGVHVTGVGSFKPDMQEIDAHTVHRATVFVDCRQACLAEAGDIIIPGADIYAELGEVLNGAKSGRQSDDEITFFKSVGVAAQDAVAASLVLHEAEKKGLGQVVALSG